MDIYDFLPTVSEASLSPAAALVREIALRLIDEGVEVGELEARVDEELKKLEARR